MSRSLVTLAGSAVLSVFLSACSDVTAPLEKDVADHRAIWSTQAMSDYSFQYELQGFFVSWANRPIRVEVRQGIVQSAAFVDTGESMPSAASAIPTIDQLFEQVSEALRARTLRAIAFHATLGHPTRIDLTGAPDASGSILVSQVQRRP